MGSYQLNQRGKLLIAEALLWMERGVSVVPAHPRSKVVTAHWREYEQFLPTEHQIKTWFSAGVNNLAVVCGTGGLTVLDFDDLDQYFAWKAKIGELVNTYAETTGRGVHLFYFVDNPKSRRFKECEVFGFGHLCNVTPSIHPNGSVYTPLGDGDKSILPIEREKLFSLLSKQPGGEEIVVGEKLSKPKVSGGSGGAVPLANNRHDLISRVKNALPLRDYVSRFTELKPSGSAGRYMVGLCPFHEDKAPSLWVDCERNIWRCYSPSCIGSRGGDLVNFYALQNGVDNRQAIARLAREVLS